MAGVPANAASATPDKRAALARAVAGARTILIDPIRIRIPNPMLNSKILLDAGWRGRSLAIEIFQTFNLDSIGPVLHC
jgi:hypothetical protein